MNLKTEPNRILVLGATGMLGHTVLRLFHQNPSEFSVWGSARSPAMLRRFESDLAKRIITGIDVENADALLTLFQQVRPTVVINCVGLVKQLSTADDPLAALPINALLPHRLARICSLMDARLVHISTDCVFSGSKGNYLESDQPDATDLYGRSKLLGEVDYAHAITLRTSIIGPELASEHGLIGWFLSQQGPVKGYTRAVFSGLPTVELAKVIRDHVLPNPGLRGTYHVSSAPIDKYSLLKLVANTYGKPIHIDPDARLIIDRSLDSTRFRHVTGYAAPEWPQLVESMHHFS